jgi:4-carboxymuconolactone decarboxylase
LNDEERRELGLQTRRDVLGDAVADRSAATVTEFTRDFRDLITRYAFGEVWARPGLDRRTRSAVMLGALTALGADTELAVHVRGARHNGLTPDEIKEVLIHMSVYCGAAAANRAFVVAEQALGEYENG